MKIADFDQKKNMRLYLFGFRKITKFVVFITNVLMLYFSLYSEIFYYYSTSKFIEYFIEQHRASTASSSNRSNEKAVSK